MPDIVVYTAISKGYDTLKAVPPLWRGSARFVAFMEEPQEVPGWEIRPMHRAFDDPCRNAKMHKLLPHLDFPEAEYSLWIDGSLRAKSQLPLDQWPEKYLRENDIIVFKHQYRHCLYAEGAWCILHGYDDASVIDRQLERYYEEGYPQNNGLCLGGVLFRRHTDKMKTFNEAWWNEIQAHSRRDQLSLNYTTWKLGFSLATFPEYISASPHFNWLKHGVPPPPKKEPIPEPGLGQMARNFTSAMAGWAKSGFKTVDKETYVAREAVCLACEHWDAAARKGLGKCRICGCSKGKLWIATSHCPLKPPKW